MDASAARLREIGDDLYARSPQEFTAARDTAAAAARSDGDRELANAVVALRRPSLAGWLVNLLALRDPAVVADLLALGDRMRTAQARAQAAQLRDLSAQRRSALDAAVHRAAALGRASTGDAPTKAQLAEVQATLAAAMADPATAELVRSGRVVKAQSYSGFAVEPTGQIAPSPVPAGPGEPGPGRPGAGHAGPTGTPGTPPPGPPNDEVARAAAQRRVEQAQTSLDEATQVEDGLRQRVEEIERDIAELRSRLDAVTREASTARQRRLAAQREFDSANRRLARLAP